MASFRIPVATRLLVLVSALLLQSSAAPSRKTSHNPGHKHVDNPGNKQGGRKQSCSGISGDFLKVFQANPKLIEYSKEIAVTYLVRFVPEVADIRKMMKGDDWPSLQRQLVQLYVEVFTHNSNPDIQGAMDSFQHLNSKFLVGPYTECNSPPQSDLAKTWSGKIQSAINDLKKKHERSKVVARALSEIDLLDKILTEISSNPDKNSKKEKGQRDEKKPGRKGSEKRGNKDRKGKRGRKGKVNRDRKSQSQ